MLFFTFQMETISCHSNESTSATAINNTIFVKANAINIFGNLSSRLPWQQIKFRGLDKNELFGRGPLKEHFCKTFVKISAVR